MLNLFKTISQPTSILATRKVLKDWHLDRMRHYAWGSFDIFAVETIPSVEEALAIIDALEEIPGARCWISFSCQDGSRTARGEPLDEVFKTLVLHPGTLE
jgi:S-methylmethionine-dependent homocysteine/selenocysteine methylase